MTSNEGLIQELDKAVADADAAHEFDRISTLLVAAREEIQRLNSVVFCLRAETERIYRYINEQCGEKIVEIVRKKIS
jgi:hypothetical protein